jgi:hypothetical protein
MSELIQHLQFFQMFITAGAGFLGIGIGIGVFKREITYIKRQLKTIQARQSRLRGDDNGGLPVFRTRLNCEALRHQCMNISDSKMSTVLEDIGEHTGSIRALDNFARWWMQKEGLTITEINNILGKK